MLFFPAQLTKGHRRERIKFTFFRSNKRQRNKKGVPEYCTSLLRMNIM